MNIVNILSYPFKQGSQKQILTGGLLSLFGILLFPIVLVFGYYYEVMHDTIKGESNPPEFNSDNLSRLAVKGIGVTFIILVYGIFLTFTIVGALYVLQPYTSLNNLKILAPNSILPALSVPFIGILTVIIIGYLMNASFVSYAVSDNILSAFSPEKLAITILSREFAVINALLVLFLFVASVILAIFSVIPLIGQLAVPFVQFPIFVITWHALGVAGKDIKYR